MKTKSLTDQDHEEECFCGPEIRPNCGYSSPFVCHLPKRFSIYSKKMSWKQVFARQSVHFHTFVGFFCTEISMFLPLWRKTIYVSVSPRVAKHLDVGQFDGATNLSIGGVREVQLGRSASKCGYIQLEPMMCFIALLSQILLSHPEKESHQLFCEW